MILSRRVALGGVQLDELHERIVVKEVDVGTPQENITAVSRMGGAGQRMTSQHWTTLDVNVAFGIDVPKWNLEERRAIFNQVITWALTKGWLTTNQMPDKRMYVDKVIVPNGGDMWDWTNDYTLNFRAYNVPFWQDEQPAQATRYVSTGAAMYLDVTGNVQTVVDATFRNRSGMTINNFTIITGGNTIRLTDLNLGGTQTLTISHGTDGILRIKIGNTSVLEKRTGADDLYVNPGRQLVSFTADRAGDFTASCYGRYL